MKLKDELFFVFKFCLIVIVCFCFFACTLSVTCVHTQGSASDVVDETQSPTSEVNASATIPGV